MNGIFKDSFYSEVAATGAALANGHRLELLDLLGQGERSVEQLARESRLSIQNASHHLKLLADAHLVARQRHGVSVRYRLASDDVLRLWLGLRELAVQSSPQMERVIAEKFGQPDGVAPVTSEELERLMELSEVVLIDVRPRLEYLAGHIPGAVSIPLEELGAALPSLPSGREVVAYCRGPFCLFSGEAVVRLREEGRRARRLAGGYPEWAISGRGVDRGAA